MKPAMEVLDIHICGMRLAGEYKGVKLTAKGCANFSADLAAVKDAVSALIAADKEYNASLEALTDLNRHIAEKGWIEVEFDALRNAGERFVKAKIARDRALERVGGAA